MSKRTVSIIIPCYNEEAGIPQLQEKLTPVVQALQQYYTPELIFVDDGSRDKTNKLLHHYFGLHPHAKIIKHEHNRNLGAAIKTGIRHATGDFVAMLDSDCTYNPQCIIEMLNIMDEKTDIITASPLHPQGKVIGVPAYRIFLSKSISNLYRLVLGSGLYTHTAMVRLYKKQVLQHIQPDSDNFLAVTELLVKSLLQNYRVKELPYTIEIRKYGESKMKFVRVALSHLRLLHKIIFYKMGFPTFSREKWGDLQTP